MIASLPMYDSYIPRESTNALWEAVLEGWDEQNQDEKERKDDNEVLGFFPPKSLNHVLSPEQSWNAGSSLFLSQTCGYPLVKFYKEKLNIVGTPLYSAPGCSGPTYRSAIIIADSNKHRSLHSFLRDRVHQRAPLTLAINSLDSFSGYLMLLSAISEALAEHNIEPPCTLVSCFVVTGSHNGSVHAIRERYCDLAAIDCVSLALGNMHHSSFLDGARVVGWSKPAYALPYVSHVGTGKNNLKRIRQAITSMLQNTEKKVMEARQSMLLAGIDVTGNISLNSYVESVSYHVTLSRRIEHMLTKDCVSSRINYLGDILDKMWPKSDLHDIISAKEELFGFFKKHMVDMKMREPPSNLITREMITEKLRRPLFGIPLCINSIMYGGKIEMLFPNLETIVDFVYDSVPLSFRKTSQGGGADVRGFEELSFCYLCGCSSKKSLESLVEKVASELLPSCGRGRTIAYVLVPRLSNRNDWVGICFYERETRSCFPSITSKFDLKNQNRQEFFTHSRAHFGHIATADNRVTLYSSHFQSRSVYSPKERANDSEASSNLLSWSELQDSTPGDETMTDLCGISAARAKIMLNANGVET